jgi:hypothetical protein
MSPYDVQPIRNHQILFHIVSPIGLLYLPVNFGIDISKNKKVDFFLYLRSYSFSLCKGGIPPTVAIIIDRLFSCACNYLQFLTIAYFNMYDHSIDFYLLYFLPPTM